MSQHPKEGGESPSASSSPLLKEPHMSPPDTPDITKSLTDPSVLTEDEGGNDGDDRMPAPGRTDSSNIRDCLQRLQVVRVTPC